MPVGTVRPSDGTRQAPTLIGKDDRGELEVGTSAATHHDNSASGSAKGNQHTEHQCGSSKNPTKRGHENAMQQPLPSKRRRTDGHNSGGRAVNPIERGKRQHTQSIFRLINETGIEEAPCLREMRNKAQGTVWGIYPATIPGVIRAIYAALGGELTCWRGQVVEWLSNCLIDTTVQNKPLSAAVFEAYVDTVLCLIDNEHGTAYHVLIDHCQEDPADDDRAASGTGSNRLLRYQPEHRPLLIRKGTLADKNNTLLIHFVQLNDGFGGLNAQLVQIAQWAIQGFAADRVHHRPVKLSVVDDLDVKDSDAEPLTRLAAAAVYPLLIRQPFLQNKVHEIAMAAIVAATDYTSVSRTYPHASARVFAAFVNRIPDAPRNDKDCPGIWRYVQRVFDVATGKDWSSSSAKEGGSSTAVPAEFRTFGIKALPRIFVILRAGHLHVFRIQSDRDFACGIWWFKGRWFPLRGIPWYNLTDEEGVVRHQLA